MQQKFELYIYYDPQNKQYKERLRGPDKKTTNEMDLFGINNALLKVWPQEKPGEFFPNDILSVLGKFTDELFPARWLDAKIEGGELKETFKYHHESPYEFKILPLPDDKLFRHIHCFGFEKIFIERAVYSWLYPTGEGRSGSKTRWTPLQKYQTKMFQDPFSFDACLGLTNSYNKAVITDKSTLIKKDFELSLLEVQRARNLQYCTVLCNYEDVTKTLRTVVEEDEYTDTKKILGKHTRLTKIPSNFFVSNNGLLPLVWAEILYAVENNIYARSCDNCGKLFAIPALTRRKGCSDECCKALKTKNDTREQKRKAVRGES